MDISTSSSGLEIVIKDDGRGEIKFWIKLSKQKN